MKLNFPFIVYYLVAWEAILHQRRTYRDVKILSVARWEHAKKKVHSVACESTEKVVRCDDTGAKRVEKSCNHRNVVGCAGN